ncbi:MAG: DUF721 domain-containing protein [Kiritimatiellales bacterium]|jgi:predicted nucleic acid-binding Zn ribbon protein
MMKSREQLKWELTRERFRIEDPRPPSARRPERHISEILSDMLKKKPVEDTSVPDILLARWPVIAGEQVAKHTRPAWLCKGILYIYADHPGWLTEIRRVPKNGLLKKIGSIPGLPKIKDLRFQLDTAVRTTKK